MWKVEPKPEPPRVPWDTLHADYAATLVALSPEIANVLRAVDEYCDCRTGQPHSLPTTFDYKRRAKIADMVEQAIKIRRDAAIAKERERCLQEKKT
jgi:phage host-nuclease inhibitor protein Gam